MAIIGVGATLTYGDDGVTFGSTISTIMEIEIPDPETGVVDTTHLGITDYVKTSIPGLIDPGELGVKCHFDKTQHAALATLQYARTTKYWKVTVDDASTDSKLIGQGFVKKCMGPTVEGPEEIVMTNFTIHCISKWTFTAGS
jgi:hypothetical protein